MGRGKRRKAAKLPTAEPKGAEGGPKLTAAERRLIRDRATAAAVRRRRLRRLVVRGLIGLGLAGFVVLFLLAAGFGQPEFGRAVAVEGQTHIPEGQPLPQRNRPPSSGPHYAARAPYGVTATPIAPGFWIHALEHGGIVVLFHCDSDEACSATARQVDEQVYAHARNGRFGERKLVATPYQDMDFPIVAVAWGRVLELDHLDAQLILAFYDRYVDRGPENAA